MKLKIWHWLFGLGLLTAISFEFMGERTAPDIVWNYPMFYATMGFFGCLFLSLLAKGMIAPSIDRPEDHYAPEDAENDWTTESPAAREDAMRDDAMRRAELPSGSEPREG